MAGKTIRVATDVGGTFTDLVCFETDNATGQSRIVTAKSDTTPPNFEQGVLNVLKKGGVEPAAVDFLAHGTTVVINALTERKGVKVGLITTEGFRDTLEIARGNRPDFFNLHYQKPKPFVPRYLRRELPGRMSYKGVEMRPLDLSGLKGILDDFKADGVQAVAICFLHSYANPSHEKAALAETQKLWPGVSAVSSHQITREWREYERTNTTVLSAYVQPIAERYLSRLDQSLKEQGFRKSPYIMQSNCGVDSLEAVSKIPITMVESGPASGFWGAAELGKLIGELNVLALDIGGTTAKCSLIQNGEIAIKTDYWIERDRTSAGYPIMVPVVDLVEIGNGGGSIAWVDDFGKLHVGPQSAGAVPGPAAYGRGGDKGDDDRRQSLARPDQQGLFLRRRSRRRHEGDRGGDGGRRRKARRRPGRGGARRHPHRQQQHGQRPQARFAQPRPRSPRFHARSPLAAAAGCMRSRLRPNSGSRKVVVPAAASVFSAWGMMMSDLRRDYFLTKLADLKPGAAKGVEAVFQEAEELARSQFAAEGVAPERVKMLRYGKFRYQNQEHTTEVLIEGGAVAEDRLAEIEKAFHQTYEREYTYRLNAPVEMVGIHLVASAEVGKLKMAKREGSGAHSQAALKGRRKVDYALEGVWEAAIYDGAKLEPGMTFAGPAIVEDAGATVVIHPGNRAEIDGYGNIHISLQA